MTLRIAFPVMVLTMIPLLPVTIYAQSLHKEANGDRLDIALSCAEDVTVSSYAALHDRVILDATARNQEELDQLAFLEAPRVRLRLKVGERDSSACWRPRGSTDFRPTLRVKLVVPENFRLAIDSGGDGNFHVAVGGQLWVDLNGSVSLEATTVNMLNLNMNGSGHVSVGHLNGPMHVELSGSGELLVRQVESDEVAIDSSGSALVKIGPGSIAALSVQTSGSGDVAIKATVTNASVATSGSSDVSIARVAGNLVKSSAGSGDIRVGR